MSSSTDWEMPLAVQPKPEHYDYDLDEALSSGRASGARPQRCIHRRDSRNRTRGQWRLIRAGVVLTIGYLITEAQTIWLHLADGSAVPGHVLAYDQETGFGLVQALARVDFPTMPIGLSREAKVGDPVVVAGAGGRKHSVAARIAAKQEFAGNWEYVLDEAIFTAPAHPFWGGTAMIGGDGALLGIGSLQVQQVLDRGTPEPLNMIVPIDILKPILEDLLTLGRAESSSAALARAQCHRDRRQDRGGARVQWRTGQRANLRTGDIVLAVAGTKVDDLAGFFRKVWSLGKAGVEVPLTIFRDGRTLRPASPRATATASSKDPVCTES